MGQLVQTRGCRHAFDGALPVTVLEILQNYLVKPLRKPAPTDVVNPPLKIRPIVLGEVILKFATGVAVVCVALVIIGESFVVVRCRAPFAPSEHGW